MRVPRAKHNTALLRDPQSLQKLENCGQTMIANPILGSARGAEQVLAFSKVDI